MSQDEISEIVGISRQTYSSIIIILMKYSFDIEGDSDGDPVEVITHDWILMLLGLLVGTLIYLF